MNSRIFDTTKSFETIVEHWAKARIDVPTQLAIRFDDAAKQLITVGGILQGLYLAAFTFGAFKDKVSVLVFLPLFVPLISLIFCAAKVICAIPLRMEAYETYKLFQGGPEISITQENIGAAMVKWCEAIEDLVEQKRKWLHRANISFFLGSVLALVMLIVSLVIYWR